MYKKGVARAKLLFCFKSIAFLPLLLPSPFFLRKLLRGFGKGDNATKTTQSSVVNRPVFNPSMLFNTASSCFSSLKTFLVPFLLDIPVKKLKEKCRA